MVFGGCLTLEEAVQLMKLHNTMVLNGAVNGAFHLKVLEAKDLLGLSELVFMSMNSMNALHLAAVRRFIQDRISEDIAEEVRVPIKRFLPNTKGIVSDSVLLPMLKFADARDVPIDTTRAEQLLAGAKNTVRHFAIY